MESEEDKAYILMLSDCLMSTILSYLDATSLYQLSRTCQYFKQIVQDQRLWRFIDARSDPNTTDKVNFCFQNINDKTVTALLRAESSQVLSIPTCKIMEMKTFINLSILALEQQRLNGAVITMKDFPPNLTELSLKGSFVKHDLGFFKLSSDNMQKLKVLVLDECDWVDCSFIMSVARYKSLEILSAVRCVRLDHDSIPYLGLARQGCKNLKLVDVRFTNIGSNLLRTLYNNKTTIACYIQSINSYLVDYKVPHNLDVKPVDEESSYNEQVQDTSLSGFENMHGCSLGEIPKSMLYKDPYRECTCGFTDQEHASEEENYDCDLQVVYNHPRASFEGLTNPRQTPLCSESEDCPLCKSHKPESPTRNKRKQSDDDDDDQRPSKYHRMEAGPSNLSIHIEVPRFMPIYVSRCQPVRNIELAVHLQRLDQNINHMFRILIDRNRERHYDEIPLKRLSLRGHLKITDKGLQYLKNLGLTLLDLTYTGVTVEGIRNFLISNPNCRIIHKNFCICKPARPT